MSNRIAELFAPKIRVALKQDWHNVVALSEFIHSHVEESSKEFECSARLMTEF